MMWRDNTVQEVLNLCLYLCMSAPKNQCCYFFWMMAACMYGEVIKNDLHSVECFYRYQRTTQFFVFMFACFLAHYLALWEFESNKTWCLENWRKKHADIDGDKDAHNTKPLFIFLVSRVFCKRPVISKEIDGTLSTRSRLVPRWARDACHAILPGHKLWMIAKIIS